MDAQTEIIKEIKSNGPISFRDFMDKALYMPLYGYYSSCNHRVGKRGDYFTSSGISPAFGAMIGRQLEEMCMQIEGTFHIVEYGGGTGLLCADIMDYLYEKPCFKKIKYVIVEKGPALTAIGKRNLRNKISWIENIGELGTFDGCVLSNELFDNLPVRVLEMEDQLHEIFVDYQNDFLEIRQTAGPEVHDYLEALNLRLPRGSRIEISMDMGDWYNQVAKYLRKGYVMSIDYGDHGRGWLKRRGESGNLRCYYNHTVHFNPYIHVGNQDITCDVNFSALSHWGALNGLEISGFTSQRNFLKGLGFVPWVSDMKETNENKIFAYDMFLNQMGMRFKVLIQRSHLPYARLQGFNFAHPVDHDLILMTG